MGSFRVIAVLLFVLLEECQVFELKGSKDKDPDCLSGLKWQNPWRPNPESKSVLGVYRHAAVASDGGPCSRHGADIMRKESGSVVDAAIATLLCNGLVNMHSMGIGGGFFMTIYNRTTGETHVIDARETAPLGANKTMFVTNYEASTIGALAVAVPGELNGYWRAHQKFGRLPWKRLFRKAIAMATLGFPMSRATSHALQSLVKDVEKEKTLESLRPILFDSEKGRWKQAGELVTNRKLGETLKRLSKMGAKEFYTGKMAEVISEEIQDGGGIISPADLRYATSVACAEERQPLIYRLRSGWRLLGLPPPASTAVLAFILNIFEKFYPGPQPRLLQSRHKTLKMLHRYVEAMKFGYAKRTFLGDGYFVNTEEVVKNLTSHAYGDFITSLIDDHTHNTSYYGPASYFENHGTSHNSFLNPDGDAVSVTSTVNAYFGAKFMGPKTGIIYNNEMNDFSIPGKVDDYGIPPSPHNWIQPGKRPMSSMAPSIILDKKGNVRMVVGASGGSKIISAVAAVIRNHLLLGQNIKEAIDMTRIHHQLIPDVVEADEGFPKELLEALHSSFGHAILYNSRRSAVVQGITVDARGVIRANCDDRKGGYPGGF